MSSSINDEVPRATFLTRDSIVETANVLKSILGREVRKSEISGLIDFMKGQNYNTFIGVDHDIVHQIIATAFSKRLQTHRTGGYVIDTHELLKRNIGRLELQDSAKEIGRAHV